MSGPSLEAYRELMTLLRHASEGAEAAGNNAARLRYASAALRAVIAFLHTDEEVRKDGLARPLALIENAVADAARGAKPPLFDHKPQGAKPSGTMSEHVQGTLAWALELLTRSKMGTQQGARWVADEARKAGLSDGDGAPVASERIITWRKDIARGKAAAAAIVTFGVYRDYDRALCDGLRDSPQEGRARAEIAARNTINSLAGIAPRAVPKPLRK